MCTFHTAASILQHFFKHLSLPWRACFGHFLSHAVVGSTHSTHAARGYLPVHLGVDVAFPFCCRSGILFSTLSPFRTLIYFVVGWWDGRRTGPVFAFQRALKPHHVYARTLFTGALFPICVSRLRSRRCWRFVLMGGCCLRFPPLPNTHAYRIPVLIVFCVAFCHGILTRILPFTYSVLLLRCIYFQRVVRIFPASILLFCDVLVPSYVVRLLAAFPSTFLGLLV